MVREAIAVLLLSLGLAAPCARAEQPASGDELLRAGRYDEAVDAYRRAVLDRPEDGALRLRFAVALAAAGRYDYAAYSLRRGIDQLGYPEALWVDVASAFGDLSAYERMRARLRAYLLRFPGEPNALTVEAFVRFMAAEMPEAHAVCEQLWRNRPGDPFAAYLVERIESLALPPWARREGSPAARPPLTAAPSVPTRSAVVAAATPPPAPARAPAATQPAAPTPAAPAPRAEPERAATPAVAAHEAPPTPAPESAPGREPRAQPTPQPAAREVAPPAGRSAGSEDGSQDGSEAARALRRRGRRAGAIAPLPPPATEPVILDGEER